MIQAELYRIKSFGSDMKSTVTLEDIADKEKELGFTLPQALQELYLTFHPDDPAFMEKGNLIPLEELKIYKRVYWTDTIITILPFCRHERYGYGFEVSRYHKSKDTMGSNDLEDPQMWGLYVAAGNTRGKKSIWKAMKCRAISQNSLSGSWNGWDTSRPWRSPAWRPSTRIRRKAIGKNAGASSGYVLSCSSGAAFQSQNKF